MEKNQDTDRIVIRGARQHNLKSIDVDLPSQKLVVVTGPSGSGKSSLAFDTLFAEAQRRYMESLSPYARQFMEQLTKPELDFIDGLSPAISIEQKTIASHPRSTVGTVTNIYDFLRLLYARQGVVKDPDTGELLKTQSTEELVQLVVQMNQSSKIQLFASVVRGKKGEFLREFEQWRRAGFTKVRIDNKMHDLHDPILLSRHQHHDIDILLDSFGKARAAIEARIEECLSICDRVSEGWLRIHATDTAEDRLVSRKVAATKSGQSLPDLEPRLFSFNSPYGMCPTCSGLGFSGPEVEEEPDDEDEDSGLSHLGKDSKTVCPTCQGSRLRQEALSVDFCGKHIGQLSTMSCVELRDFFSSAPEQIRNKPVAARILLEIETRLKFLCDVGVGYLQLGRRAGTLSGGEAQRIRLATQLGSSLSGVLYVLDEPSIGLHPRDQQKLLASLIRLRDLGNTVVVVEHDEETMLAADHLIDIGPGAGVHGGHLVSSGSPQQLVSENKTLTAKYLSGTLSVSDQRPRRPGNGSFITASGCRGHNLKDVNLKLPLGKFIVFTGVSGSGKSSLVRNTLEAAIAQRLYRSSSQPLPHQSISGLENIDKLVHVDQRPIGRSPRSNPATYTGLLSVLRGVYAQLPDAQIRGYTPGTFSFNVKGGRCDSCEGAGKIKVVMHFLPDVLVPCEACLGSRYRPEVLDVRFRGKSIADVLAMPIEEAHDLFRNQPQIEPKLKTMVDVGLGYVQLGQSAITLSGGEAQRTKLAKELSKKSTGKTLYVLDEPTTGLHFEDVRKLLNLLHRLSDLGNTVVVIEHHMDVIASADWLVDMGPDAGALGGEIVFQGTPEALVSSGTQSPTQKALSDHFRRRKWPLTH